MTSSAGQRRFARIDRLPPYVFNITAELKLAARRRGEDIIDMSMGNPDGATPPHIVAKLNEVAQRPDTHGYSASKGIPRLRRAISHWYQDRYQVEIDPDAEAIVTIGSKEGLAHLMLATLDRGDTVYCLTPLHHQSGLLVSLGGAVVGGTRIALSRGLRPDRFVHELRQYGVTVVSYTWAMLREVIAEGPVVGAAFIPDRDITDAP
jgi:alanine-synthesizing transaminase